MADEVSRFTITMFNPGDAEDVAGLFRAVYGEGYPVRNVYNPPELIESFRSGDNIPVVVRAEDGRIIGYEALYRSSPNPRVYEAGQGLVLPEYRGGGVAGRVNAFVCDVLVPTLDVDVIFGEAVCNHSYMQRSWSAFQTVPTALEVDLMPAEAYTKEHSAAGRVSALPMFRTYRKRPHAVYAPRFYLPYLKTIYAGLDDERTILEAGESDTPRGATRMNARVFDFASVARLAVPKAGHDFVPLFREEEAALLASGMKVIQVWLNLSQPSLWAPVRHLREAGYFFGGILPRWFDTDGLLMQKLLGPPNWEGIDLYQEQAKKIREFVYRDWRETASERPLSTTT